MAMPTSTSGLTLQVLIIRTWITTIVTAMGMHVIIAPVSLITQTLPVSLLDSIDLITIRVHIQTIPKCITTPGQHTRNRVLLYPPQVQ